jgi:hypothetical protein
MADFLATNLPDDGTPYRELLIGCGNSRVKKLKRARYPAWQNLTTIDIDPNAKPDLLWNLTDLPLPFEENTFNEIHAYEVLEHTGRQGDYVFFFAQFTDFWRILKPGGLLFATAPLPNSVWAWGDPSHSRILSKESLTFLDQQEYINQVGITPMSDFRYLYQADFVLALLREDATLGRWEFTLQAVKPSRIPEALRK